MAPPRHRREPDARRPRLGLPTSRPLRLAAGVAVVATLPIVGAGVVAADHDVRAALASPADDSPAPDRLPQPDRPAPAHGRSLAALEVGRIAEISRSLDRAARPSASEERARARAAARAAARATARAVAGAHLKRWSTTDLNLWSSAGATAVEVGELAPGKPVLVTGRAADGRVEVVLDGRSRWVTAGYLSASKPETAPTVTAAAGLSMTPCPDSSVEYRLTSGAVYVYRSVCHAFPQITSYGGYAPRGEHASGKALDIMTTDLSLGNAIAAFLQQHAAELHIYDIIWQQHIWTPVRASEGWRMMPDRGSPTANHMNHVHVSVY